MIWEDAGNRPGEMDRLMRSHARALGIRGLLAVLFGIMAIWAPFAAVSALVMLFGAYCIIDGALRLTAESLRARSGNPPGFQVFAGAASIAAGLAILVVPHFVTLSLTLFAWVAIALWALATGVLDLAGVYRFRKAAGHIPLRTLGAVLTTGLGVWMVILLFTRPMAGLPILGMLLGVYALASGAFLVALARRIHRLTKAGDGKP